MNEEILRNILEEYQKQNMKIFDDLSLRLDGLGTRFGGLETKVDKLENTVDKLGNKFTTLEGNFDKLGNKVDNNFETLTLSIRDLGVLVEKNSDDIRVLAEQVADIPLLRQEVRGNNLHLDRVEGKVDAISGYLQNNLDPRIVKIEEVVF
jgi:archaellum component FlaC